MIRGAISSLSMGHIYPRPGDGKLELSRAPPPSATLPTYDMFSKAFFSNLFNTLCLFVEILYCLKRSRRHHLLLTHEQAVEGVVNGKMGDCEHDVH